MGGKAGHGGEGIIEGSARPQTRGNKKRVVRLFRRELAPLSQGDRRPLMLQRPQQCVKGDSLLQKSNVTKLFISSGIHISTARHRRPN